jgi:hypothetical protein
MAADNFTTFTIQEVCGSIGLALQPIFQIDQQFSSFRQQNALKIYFKQFQGFSVIISKCIFCSKVVTNIDGPLSSV